MSTYRFTLAVGRRLNDDEQDALYEAGFDDSTVELEASRTLLHVIREARSLEEALGSAQSGLNRIGLAATHVVESDQS